MRVGQAKKKSALRNVCARSSDDWPTGKRAIPSTPIALARVLVRSLFVPPQPKQLNATARSTICRSGVWASAWLHTDRSGTQPAGGSSESHTRECSPLFCAGLRGVARALAVFPGPDWQGAIAHCPSVSCRGDSLSSWRCQFGAFVSAPPYSVVDLTLVRLEARSRNIGNSGAMLPIPASLGRLQTYCSSRFHPGLMLSAQIHGPFRTRKLPGANGFRASHSTDKAHFGGTKLLGFLLFRHLVPVPYLTNRRVTI